MPIRMAYTDPASGAVYPAAYWNADDVRIGLKELFTEVTLGIYVDADQFTAGSSPLTTVVKRFTDAENNAAKELLTDTLYAILVARSEFAAGAVV